MGNEYLSLLEKRHKFAGGYQRFDFEKGHEDLRSAFVFKYSWAIPGPAAVKKIAALSPIIEIGAGSGYWAYLLQEEGADVLAYDLHPPGSVPDEHPHNPWHSKQKPWTSVIHGDHSVVHGQGNRTLFLCWPPYEDPMAFNCLSAYMVAGGTTLAYIGESHGGCTGCDKFHQLLASDWKLVDDVDLPHWEGIHDYLSIYKRIDKHLRGDDPTHKVNQTHPRRTCDL